MPKTMKTKRIVALAILLSSAIGAQAQYSDGYYHHMGDTVYTRSEIGYYAWWDFDSLVSMRAQFWYSNGTLYWRPLIITPYFTPAPLQVVGIAGCFYDASWLGASLPEYVYLFDNGANGPVFLDSVQIHVA